MTMVLAGIVVRVDTVAAFSRPRLLRVGRQEEWTKRVITDEIN